MGIRRKFILGAGALTLVTGAVLVTGAGLASAKAGSAQKGTLNCNKITGTFTFNPPLKATSTSTDVATVKSTITGCTASGGGLTPKKGTSSQMSSYNTNSCTAILEGSPKAETITTTWSPKSIASTTTAFPASAEKISTGPPITITLGGTGTTDEAGSSYEGTDGGATSTVSLTLKQTSAEIMASCTSSKGLKTLNIVSGSAHAG
jgi:hypothetical protein